VNLGWPVLLKLEMMEVVVTTGVGSPAKLQPNNHHQQTNTQLFTGQMPSCHQNNSQSNEGKVVQITY